MKYSKVLLILAVLCLGSLALASVLNKQCEKSCLAEAFAKGAEHGFGSHVKINFSHDEGDTDDAGASARLSQNDGTRKRNAGQVTMNYDQLKEIDLRGYVTDWTIARSEDAQVHLSFQDYLEPAEWNLLEADHKLTLTLGKEGPGSARLLLPANYQGSLQLASVSGRVTVDAGVSLKDLEVQIVSGSLSMKSLPLESFKVEAVSGDVKIEAQEVSPLLDISIEGVSGVYKLSLNQRPKSLKAETLSGDFELNVPKTLGFDYRMSGLNASFEGLPEEGKGDATRGSFGDAPRADLRFESMSGTFTLKQRP